MSPIAQGNLKEKLDALADLVRATETLRCSSICYSVAEDLRKSGHQEEALVAMKLATEIMKTTK